MSIERLLSVFQVYSQCPSRPPPVEGSGGGGNTMGGGGGCQHIYIYIYIFFLMIIQRLSKKHMFMVPDSFS